MKFIIILLISLSAHSTQATSCNPSPVFAFSQALYWQQYQRASQLLPRIERERSVEMAEFLAQVLQWKQGYDLQNKRRQHAALDEIDRQISLLEAGLTRRPSAKLELSAGNITLHAARINLAMGRVIRAAKLAKRGDFLINKVLGQNPNEADALLATGLYQFYTGSEQPGFGWVKQWFSLHGDEKRGRRLIERAMAQSPDFAFEAARSLKMDLDWNKQDVCRYPDLAEPQQTGQIQALEVAQLDITTDLFCGRTQAANLRLQSLKLQLEQAQAEVIGWFDDAHLYALGQAGEVEKLSAMLDAIPVSSAPLKRLKTQFSLAKALDIKGRRDRSQVLYNMLVESELEDQYKNLAKRYLVKPYRAPVAILPSTTLLACSNH